MPVLRVGIVGLGFGAQVQLPGFMSIEGIEVTSFADADEGIRHKISACAGIKKVYDRWQDLIADPEVDAVSVATPPQFQAQIVCAALALGKHVLCEKPFGLNVKQAEEMLMAANASGRVHAVDFQFRMEPGLLALKREIARGVVGKVRRIDVDWLTAGGTRSDVPWSWKHDASLRGGVLESFGSHVLDYVPWLCQSRITSVFAQTAIWIEHRKDGEGNARPCTGEDSCDLICRLEGGAIANMSFSNCHAFPLGHRIEIYGDKGRLSYLHKPPFAPGNADLFVETDEGISQIGLQVEAGTVADDSRIVAFRKLAMRFLRAISGDSEADLPDFARGLQVRKLLDAAHDSMTDGRRIETF